MPRKKTAAEKPTAEVALPLIRAERYEVFFSDAVNVATRPDLMAFTFYCTIPDPLQDTPKRPIRQALAVVQTPPEVALQLPAMILGQAAGNPTLPVDALRLISGQLADLRAQVERVIKEREAK